MRSTNLVTIILLILLSVVNITISSDLQKPRAVSKLAACFKPLSSGNNNASPSTALASCLAIAVDAFGEINSKPTSN